MGITFILQEWYLNCSARFMENMSIIDIWHFVENKREIMLRAFKMQQIFLLRECI
jgi:hypothetical protein